MPHLFIFKNVESTCTLVKHACKVRKVFKKTVQVVLNNRLHKRDHQAQNLIPIFCGYLPACC